ncbi:hypothetical protein GN958_ATG13819 [Phytophthora infestans]|uniref:Uncharacterized protein n=1 Tax=Phytophthora infestans TaxID=4787 RepID=A0A8S9U9I7_PHYIN|nr:hypothetical protein GN958_ATG13819 [Phytophthora infestans]
MTAALYYVAAFGSAVSTTDVCARGTEVATMSSALAYTSKSSAFDVVGSPQASFVTASTVDTIGLSSLY